MKTLKCVYFFLILFSLEQHIFGQIKEKVEVVPKIPVQTLGKKCGQLQLGKIVFFLEPDYPPEAKAARVAGTVVINIKLNEKGVAPEIEKVSGHKLLRPAALEAARKMKFTPTVCDGVGVAVRVTMNYNFILYIVNEGYFKPSKIEEFPDVKNDSQFYEAILDLTENYRLAFGYADKNFYPDAPLTRGDFAHFLRLTLDLLSERARAVNKFPRQINLFYSHNPQNIKSIDKIRNLGKNEPFLESVKVLLLKYDIAAVNEKGEFQGKAPLTQSQIVSLWAKIFGADAVPVNFAPENGERIMTRGEFALFLQESLGVLTYKVLP